MGRGRQRVPGLSVRHLGDEPRTLPSARRGGGARAGRHADAHEQPLLHRAGDAPGHAAVASRASAARCSSATPARRPTRRRSSSRARRVRGGDFVVAARAPFTGARTGRCRPRPQEAKQAPFAPLVPGFRAGRAEPEALAGAVDEQTAAVIVEPIQGESGVHVALRRAAARRARGLRRARRGADLRRDPDAAWGGRARCGPTSRPACGPTR